MRIESMIKEVCITSSWIFSMVKVVKRSYMTWREERERESSIDSWARHCAKPYASMPQGRSGKTWVCSKCAPGKLHGLLPTDSVVRTVKLWSLILSWWFIALRRVITWIDLRGQVAVGIGRGESPRSKIILRSPSCRIGGESEALLVK